MESEFYSDSAYTADISTKMRVPDKLMAHNGHGEDVDAGHRHAERSSIFNMAVPERILVAGGEQHVYAKSTPRELQLENSVIPPTPEHVRVHTPPRSIRLDDVPFPSAGDTPDPLSPPKQAYLQSYNKKERSISFDPEVSLSQGSEQNLSLYDEVQRMRTQMAKLNHRLMAMELESQQQNQRWQVASVLVSAYFLVKALAWMNRN